MPARQKLTEEQVKKIRRRVARGERLTALAAEFGVVPRTLRRRIDAAELDEAKRAQDRAAKRADDKRMKRLLGAGYRNPSRAPEHRRGERRDPPPASESRSGQTSGGRVGFAEVPLFPHTPAGLAERFAYYEARALNDLPNSLYDFHDVRRGQLTPAERRAREARAAHR